MVKYEVLNDKFCRHYSDNNKLIHKIGTEEMYSEAVDLIPCKFEYEETDIKIEVDVDEKDEEVII